jgi:Methane oxygenase PmoA
MIARRAFLLGGALSPLTNAAIRSDHVKGEKVSFYEGARLLFEYRYSADVPKTYMHPFCAPDGNITLDSPADHVHHRGVMLAWSDVNGFDFWGEQNPAKHGRIVHRRFADLRKDKLVSLEDWVAEGKTLLTERRTIAVPISSKDAVWLDWTSELSAVSEPVQLSAAQHVYNGLGIRFAHELDGGNVLNSKGTTGIEKTNGDDADWCAYAVAVPKRSVAGAVIFNHPSNPRHPIPFFVMNKPFGYISAAPTFREPFRLEPGRPLRLRFALVGFNGEPSVERMNGMFRQWVRG